MSEVVKVGGVVPDFDLEVFNPKTKGFETVSTKKLKEKGKWVVLVFYPADYTFVCPTELADVAHKQAEFEKAGAVVISVSTDSKFVHMAWQREETLLKNVEFYMGADTNRKVSELFGVLDPETGMAYRGTFIISPTGQLTGSEVNFFNVGRSAEELLRKVRANVYLADRPEEACPANWSEGQKTLKPGADLVGRVGAALN